MNETSQENIVFYRAHPVDLRRRGNININPLRSEGTYYQRVYFFDLLTDANRKLKYLVTKGTLVGGVAEKNLKEGSRKGGKRSKKRHDCGNLARLGDLKNRRWVQKNVTNSNAKGERLLQHYRSLRPFH